MASTTWRGDVHTLEDGAGTAQEIVLNGILLQERFLIPGEATAIYQMGCVLTFIPGINIPADI